MPKTSPATLDSFLIEKVRKGFPDKHGWCIDRCSEFKLKKKGRRQVADWRKTDCKIGTEAGLYAFLFPVAEFPPSFMFRLHGPSKKGKSRRIPFEVRLGELQTPLPGYFVAYVGRSANLAKRIKLHFHATKSTTAAQVRESLLRCMRYKTNKALEFMLKHALIAHYSLKGRENVANRDIIEVALWAQYRTPFNIKSER